MSGDGGHSATVVGGGESGRAVAMTEAQTVDGHRGAVEENVKGCAG